MASRLGGESVWQSPQPGGILGLEINSESAFRQHIAALGEAVARSLEVASAAGESFGGLVLHAGSRQHYHADDLEVPFRSTPHFARFAPLAGPDHLIRLRPGETPLLVHVTPRDYWFAPSDLPDHPFREVLDLVEVATGEEAVRQLADVSDCAYLGPDASLAEALGITATGIEPPALVRALDWHRGFKTDYEVARLREAARRAGPGHAAARQRASQGASEREIQAAYLLAAGVEEGDTPYHNIVAWDVNSAVLHYQTRRALAPAPAHCFLIDAGAQADGYASDITRTYTQSGVHPVFGEALVRMEALQDELVRRVAPAQDFVDLHREAERGVCQILCDLGVLRCDSTDAFERGLSHPFLPHGLGHHLGLQVHDVGGLQHSIEGDFRLPPDAHPHLRTTRPLAAGNVVTVEPGLYFISMLLDEQRAGPAADVFDWRLIDQLVPAGGIRVEDDVLVTEQGYENLSRPWVPLATRPAGERENATP